MLKLMSTFFRNYRFAFQGYNIVSVPLVRTELSFLPQVIPACERLQLALRASKKQIIS